MVQVMKGFRVLEVAQFTFVPGGRRNIWPTGVPMSSRSSIPVRGDTQRGFINMGGVTLDPQRHTLIEHPNRGKRSVGIDVSTPGGQEVLYELAKTADVFLTNYLPSVRQKNKFDVEHIRAVNPNIIYARGSAYGNKGEERKTGGFDGTAFWSRSGVAHAMTPPNSSGPLAQGIPAFGDSIGGDVHCRRDFRCAYSIARRTGEALEHRCLASRAPAWWASGALIAQGHGNRRHRRRNAMPRSGGTARNPFSGNFSTSDGGTINLCINSAARIDP